MQHPIFKKRVSSIYPRSLKEIWNKMRYYFTKNRFMIFVAAFVIILSGFLVSNYHYFFINKQMRTESFVDIQAPNQEYINNTLTQHKKDSLFPYRYLTDENGTIIPVVLISGFFRDDKSRDMYAEYIKNGIQVVGITAYKSFPLKITDSSEDKYHHTDTFDYIKKIKNWICCFKNPAQYGLSSTEHNLIDMSESDFYDVDQNYIPVEKKYDIIYSCLKDGDNCPMDGWNAINRNYDLALKCLPIMINKFGLKVLAVGRVGCGLEEIYGDRIETTDFLPYNEFQDKIRESRILFVPNVYDASPRVVSESIINNVPVLMNKGILCGSKYIHDETGELFTDENDFSDALDKLLSKIDQISPKDWWPKQYGRKVSGKKLRDYLNECYSGLLENVKEVYF